MNIIVFVYATYANAWLESYCSQSTMKKTSITENLGADEKHLAKIFSISNSLGILWLNMLQPCT